MTDVRDAFRDSQQDNVHGPGAIVKVYDRSSVWIGVVGILFGLAGLLMAWHAEREASIATMRVEGMTRALIAHGIKDTYPHVPGEDD